MNKRGNFLAISVLTLGLALAGAAWGQAEAKATGETSMLQELMVHHTQGWGELGIDTAAHAADKQPLPLQIGDKKYATGLGDHAPSETTLLLDGRYATFECEVGVQPQGGNAGSVVFRVLVDGNEVFNSGVRRGGEPPVPVNVKVAGASELQLVAEDAGDGFACDMANWAGIKLVADPAATAAAAQRPVGVDIAPFGKVAAWDPARTEGTHATRLEPVPAADLFLETELVPDAQGQYVAKTYGDGRACIGLEWFERRAIQQVGIEFAGPVQGLDAVKAEYWQMKKQNSGAPGGSRWQGDWLPLEGIVKVDGARLTLTPAMGDPKKLWKTALKVRWIIPASAASVPVKRLTAYTRTAWKDAEVIVQSEGAGTGQITLYNGEYLGGEPGVTRTYSAGTPLNLKMRYCPPRPWQLVDRTVLRFQTPKGAFGVAVDDVLAKGAVYVEYAGVLVCDAAKPQTLDAYRASVGEQKTILERVRSMPDQTCEQAMERVHRPEADLGPTMLSLAADNCKFIVERDGAIRFDDRPEVYNQFDSGYYGDYRCQMTPRFGAGKADSTARHPIDSYVPVPVLTVTEQGVAYQQTTAVAPFGQAARPEGTPWWLTYRPLGVVDYSIKNTTKDKRDYSLALSFVAGPNTPAEISREGARVLVNGNGHLFAVIDLHDEKANAEIVQGVVTLRGSLESLKSAACSVYLPRWDGAAAGDLAAPSPSQLIADAEAYWRRIVNEGMQIDVPDDLIRNTIPASRVHCLLAARNEGYTRIAPWIASWYYGPLESEANSVLRGMLAQGDDDFVRRGLEYYIQRYNKEGFVTTGYTLMGTGWHLWTLGEYYSLTKNKEWLKKWAPEVARVCRWISEQRRGTMRLDARGEKVAEYGLMPPGVGADWDVYAYYFYLQGYYCAGLHSAASALADIGFEGAKELVTDADAYREDILRAFRRIQALAPVFPLRDGTWVPEYPTHVFAPCPIGNLYVNEDGGRSWCYDVELGSHHLVPFGILGPNEPETAWMMDHMEDVQFLHAGWFYYEKPEKNEADWFNLGGFAKVQPYYARTGEVHAQRDDVKPFIRTYFNSVISLLNREDLSLWEHFMNGAYNKTHETGYFLHQSRLMFVQERGDELWLAPFVTNNWLRDGMRVAVSNAPTAFGKVGYTIESRVAEGVLVAHVDAPKNDALHGVAIRLRHPADKRLVKAECEGVRSYTVDTEKSVIHFVPSGEPVTVRAHYE